MKVGICVLAACLLAASAAANAKIVHRWSPEALAQGKFVAEKTAFVRKEVKQGGGMQVENKHILVKVDYTGKLFQEPYMVAKK